MSNVPDSAQPVSFRQGLGKLLSLCNNPMSIIGLALVALGLFVLIWFLTITVFSERGTPYLDIIGYMVAPSIFIIGLIIVPIGSLWKWYYMRRRPGVALPRHVHVDLNDAGTRSAVFVLIGASFFVILPALAVSGYQGYVYSESTEFCAKACHAVMEPQAVAHASSAHARVSCAECHIGEGVGWFVKSKLSGTRQVLAVYRDSFSRPIPPAITELRPARETCEHCHWPEKFFGSKLRETAHFSPDEENTRRVVRMLLKVGGADESIGRAEGIHMHMMASGSIEYVARDEHLQDIPWVRYTQPDGTVRIFRSDGLPNDAPPPSGTPRTVDCMDCHNRGAHHFRPPEVAVDLALQSGHLDPTLPYIKREAVAVLGQTYGSVSEANTAIETRLTTFYQEQYPQIWEQRRDDVHAAITRVKETYRRNLFPGMKVDWTTYPENIGHMISPGCMRCHDGLHIDAEGTPISSDCTVCHTFLNEVPDSPNQFEEGSFHHSMPLIGHEQLRCDQCHSGGGLLRCRDCHAELKGLTDWRDLPRLRRTGSD